MKLKIAFLQLLPGAAIEDNIEKGIKACREAKEKGADIALFPEMWSSGYVFPHNEEWLNKNSVSLDSAYLKRFSELALELDMAIAITLLEKHEPNPRNTVCLFERHGKLVYRYSKVHICNFGEEDDESVLDNLYTLSDSPTLLGELQTLLRYQYSRIDFIDEPVDVGFDCPLDLHCTYTRDQLLVALDFLKPATVREGVKWLPDKNLDVLFVTLNKADKDYSPTTMYKDYSINESLFHWQSQSTTAENSATGQRYIHHREKGNRMLLFVREFKTDSRFGGAAAYTYLGTVNYVKHDGSRPMNITWKLDCPIPAKFLKRTNKLVVG